MEELISVLRINARERHIPVMEDEPARLLAKVVAERQPQRILEIGTAIGYSGLIMLNSARWAKLTTIEIDADRMEEAKRNFEKAGVNERVRCIEDDANLVVSLMDGQYDFILLDGPKGHYHTMFTHLLRLLSRDGMIFIDDILYQGFIVGENYPAHKHRTIITNIRYFLKQIAADDRLDTQLHTAGDGVMLVKYKENNYGTIGSSR
ncbi:MAG: O-methyltransferase [Clostridia bacterium]|nr:O-methyltransferase [Clostridia bacterium]